jgi:hypothetical protein
VTQQVESLKESVFVIASETPKNDDDFIAKIEFLEAKIERMNLMFKYQQTSLPAMNSTKPTTLQSLRSPQTAGAQTSRRRYIDVASSNMLPTNLLMAQGSSLTTKFAESRVDIKRTLNL